MLYEQGDEADESIQVVVAFGADDGGAGGWVVLLLSLSTVAYFNTHLRAQPEETSDEVVSFQDALLMHLKMENKNTTTIFLSLQHLSDDKKIFCLIRR